MILLQIYQYSKKYGIILLTYVLLVIAIYLRFVDLGRGSYWLDEFSTVNFAQKPLGDLFIGKYYEPGKSPFHFLLLGLWIRVFGNSEVATRSMFVIINCFTIPLFYYFVRLFIKDKKISLLGTALYAISWLNIWGAREARYYSLLLVFSLLSTIYFLHIIHDGTHKIAYILSITLNLYTHILAFLLLIAHLITYLIIKKKIDKNIIIYILPSVLFSPYLYQMIFYIDKSNPTSIFNTVGQLHEQLRGAPMTFYSLMTACIYNVSFHFVYIFIFGLLVLHLSLAITRIQGIQKIVVILFLVVLGISTFPPFNILLTNNYYLYYLLPLFFGDFLILIAMSKRIWEKLIITGMIGVYLYSNLWYVREYHKHVNIWRFNDIASYVNSLNSTQVIYFSNCIDYYLTNYYVSLDKYKNVTCNFNEIQNNKNIRELNNVYTYWDNNSQVDLSIQKLHIIYTGEISFGPSLVKKYYVTTN